ncbi:MAG: hypothetical protein ABSD58_06920 [Verrucomicrobiia bacterium]|jgi:hypothetical protein
MSVRANIWRVLLTAGCVFVPCLFTHADDTNPPVIATPPATASASTTNLPTAAAQPTDPERFFSQYAKATDLVRQNARQEASVIMDLLWRNLSTSPWFEIALLKHAELNEASNPQVAAQDYDVLRKRVENAPYFQGNAERAAVFRTALLGAVGRGIDRLHIQSIHEGLNRYQTRYHQYPESLVKLAIFNYVDMGDIYDSEGRLFRYTPTGIQFTPTISYQRYDLASLPSEPFYVTSPKVSGTTRVDDKTVKYAAVILVPERIDWQSVVEGQTLGGYFVASVDRGGAIVCTTERILVLPVPQ